MHKMLRVFALAVALGAVTAFASFSNASPTADANAAHPAAIQPGNRIDRQAFHDAMRKLWEDHITWTRLVIVSKLTLPQDLPDLGATVNRLLQNQVDIGNAIAPFYGAAAGQSLTALLRDHILIAAEILAAAKANDKVALQDAIARWEDNGRDIAAFLNAANPRSWPLAEMEEMMQDHLDLTFAEAVARLSGNYAADIAAYDEVHEQILEMADMLSDGIIRQFPQMFSGAR
jgi:hypothetical protein